MKGMTFPENIIYSRDDTQGTGDVWQVGEIVPIFDDDVDRMTARGGVVVSNLGDDPVIAKSNKELTTEINDINKQIENMSVRPTYLNTGIVNPAMLQAGTGRQRLRLAVDAIEYLDIDDGYVTYEKDDARVYNCHIKPSVSLAYGLQEAGDIPDDGWSGLLFQDCEIGGGPNNFTSAPIIGRGWTLRRCYLHQSDGDGIKAQGNNLIEDCFITDLGRNTLDSHADGLQMTKGSNVTCRNTFFDMPVTPNNLSNAFVILKSSDGDIFDIDIDGCYFKGSFDGPNYALYLYEENGYTIRNVKIRNCIFEVGLNPVRLLAITNNAGAKPEYEWTNNKWSDGTPIPDPHAAT